MNAPATNKPVNKVIAKPNTAKLGADQEKAINQLRQEIRTLSKSVKEMQQRPDAKAAIFLIPNKLLSKVNAYLSDCERSSGIAISLSELICDALDVYIWAEEGIKPSKLISTSSKNSAQMSAVSASSIADVPAKVPGSMREYAPCVRRLETRSLNTISADKFI